MIGHWNSEEDDAMQYLPLRGVDCMSISRYDLNLVLKTPLSAEPRPERSGFFVSYHYDRHNPVYAGRVANTTPFGGICPPSDSGFERPAPISKMGHSKNYQEAAMAKRKAVSKKTRFEVFKRDNFTCQYCGTSAPDVILHLDHLSPVSKGGDNDILNLITSCINCNSGKGNVLLDDDSVIQKQRRQLLELNERREQLEMMLKWREGLKDIKSIEVESIAEAFKDATGGYYSLNEGGLSGAKKFLKKHSVSDILDALDKAVDKYLSYDDEDIPEKESVDLVWRNVSVFLAMASKPEHEREIYYIRGILRRRLNFIKDDVCLRMLREAYEGGVPLEELKDIALSVRNWTELNATLYNRIGRY